MRQVGATGIEEGSSRLLWTNMAENRNGRKNSLVERIECQLNTACRIF
jgi:hypothetical protein